jgi:C4-dicarboxylate-specific signal transduction histidine kinase
MDDSSFDLERRIQRAKLDALKELAYGASHEINNPLANISARAQSLLRDETQAERRRSLLAMRAHEMISDLMLFARPPELQVSQIDFSNLMSRVVDESRDVLGERRISATFEVDKAAPAVHADPTQLSVLLSCVLRNAIEAIAQNGAIALHVRRGQEDELIAPQCQAACCVTVSDNGPGFSERALAHAFDPFFSGREAGRGLGFGLSKCWRIANQHGGEMRIANIPGGGARVSLLMRDRPPVDAA